MLHSICQQIFKSSAVATGLEKVTFHSRKAMPKNVHTTIQLCSFHMLVRLCSKSFELGFNSTWTENFQMVQAGFKKCRVVKDQIASICCIMEKARAFEKNFCFTDYTKAFHCVDHNKFLKRKFTNFMCGKFLKRWEYQTTLRVSWETCMQLELDIEQQTSAKLGNKYDKAVYCHPAYLTCMQSTCEMPAWMNHKLESRLLA